MYAATFDFYNTILCLFGSNVKLIQNFFSKNQKLKTSFLSSTSLQCIPRQECLTSPRGEQFQMLKSIFLYTDFSERQSNLQISKGKSANLAASG